MQRAPVNFSSITLGRDGIAGLIGLAVSLLLLPPALSLPKLPIVPVGPGFYPTIVLVFMALTSALLLLQDIRAQRRPAAAAAEAAAAVPRAYGLVAAAFAAVGVYLALLPLITIVGFGTLALLPTAAALMAVQVARRSGDYAIARPTREVLYTVVPREDRYKTKSFIDTVVYRAGDQIGAWSFVALTGLGLGVPEIAIAGAVLGVAWLVNAYWLGRRQDALALSKQEKIEDPSRLCP